MIGHHEQDQVTRMARQDRRCGGSSACEATRRGRAVRQVGQATRPGDVVKQGDEARRRDKAARQGGQANAARVPDETENLTGSGVPRRWLGAGL